MEVHELPPGEQAPETSDRITINKLESGKTGFTGIRLVGTVHHHSVSPNSFENEEEALTAALAWADENGVEVLYVERPVAG